MIQITVSDHQWHTIFQKWNITFIFTLYQNEGKQIYYLEYRGFTVTYNVIIDTNRFLTSRVIFGQTGNKLYKSTSVKNKLLILNTKFFFFINIYVTNLYFCIRVLAAGAVDLVFESRSSQTKYYAICVCCFSVKHAKICRFGISIMCLRGMTCLSVSSCFRELAPYKSNWACWSRKK